MKSSQISNSANFKETLDIKKELDPDWVELIKEAKRSGITIEEIRRFLKKAS